jgi:hypothetical protein
MSFGFSINSTQARVIPPVNDLINNIECVVIVHKAHSPVTTHVESVVVFPCKRMTYIRF